MRIILTCRLKCSIGTAYGFTQCFTLLNEGGNIGIINRCHNRIGNQ